MRNVTQLYRLGINAATSNAPALLTAFGAVGVVTTAVLTAKASFKAVRALDEAFAEKNIDVETPIDDYGVALTTTEKLQVVAPLYVSAVFSGVLSCGAIIMAHRISAKRAAVLAAAYAMNEDKLEELQKKVREKLGDKKADDMRDEMVADKVFDTYDDNQVIQSKDGAQTVLHDQESGRYFMSSIDKIEKAVNEANHQINVSYNCATSLNSFYDSIGLDRIPRGDDMGWNVNERCEVVWTTTTTPDGTKAVHSFGFANPPKMDYDANFR